MEFRSPKHRTLPSWVAEKSLVESVVSTWEGTPSTSLFLRSTPSSPRAVLAGDAEAKAAKKATKRVTAPAKEETRQDIFTDWESGGGWVGVEVTGENSAESTCSFYTEHTNPTRES